MLQLQLNNTFLTQHLEYHTMNKVFFLNKRFKTLKKYTNYTSKLSNKYNYYIKQITPLKILRINTFLSR